MRTFTLNPLQRGYLKLSKLPLFPKLLIIYFLIAIALFGHGAYIKAKAQLAQVLLEVAWQKQQQSFEPHKAWSWADGYPVAKLAIGSQSPFIVLSGATGNNLAFAPSWLETSSTFGTGGNSVIFAHNDTHFKGLKEIKLGSLIEVETPKGALFSYRVSNTKVVDETDLSVLEKSSDEVITLITCYPFDSSIVHSNLRFVVTAKREK